MFDFISKKFSSMISELTRAKKLTFAHVDEWLSRIKDTLIEADVSLEVVQAFIESVKREAIGKRIEVALKPGEQFVTVVRDQLITFMGGAQEPFTFDKGATVLMMGLQGAGKTTTIGKLAHLIAKTAQVSAKKDSVMVASVDFNRPAAIDQLEQLAKQVGIVFYRAASTSIMDAVGEIVAYRNQNRFDYLFLDTAGRLQVDECLMDELVKIKKALNPSCTIMVIDGMTGQEGLSVARSFQNQLSFDGAIITKMDSDARGGIAFSFSYALGKKVLFLAEGEKVADLLPFDAKRMTSRILGMGDIATLSERASEKMSQFDAQKATSSLEEGRLSFRDFSKQLAMMSQLGSMSQLIKYLPTSLVGNVSATALRKSEIDMKKHNAIFSSLSKKELDSGRSPSGYRKKQIAFGAGVSVKDIDLLFERFAQAQQYVKLLKGNNYMKNNVR